MTRLLLNSTSSTAATSPPHSLSSSSSDAAEPPQMVESDFVVILAGLLCALICVVGLISVARCACTRSGSNNNNNGRSAGGHEAVANRGLKKKVVQSLPKYTYDSSSMEVENNPGSDGANATTTAAADCAICLADYVDGDEIRVLPQCGHRFHVQCIDLWLSSRSSCPSCRQILVVTRCHKCAEFPPVSAGVSSQAQMPAEFSGRTRDTTSGSNNFLP